MITTSNINSACRIIGKLPISFEKEQDKLYEIMDKLEPLALEEGRKPEHPFYGWITSHFISVDNDIGDVARNIENISDFPKNACSYQYVSKFLLSKGLSEDIIQKAYLVYYHSCSHNAG